MKPCCRAFSNRYELLRVLGEGAQGIVFLCKDRATGCLVACKTCWAHAVCGPTRGGHVKVLVAKTLRGLQLALAAAAVGLSHEKRMELKAAIAAKPVAQKDMDLRWELLLVSALEHENILPVESSFESEDGFMHLVTPFCAGGTLSQFLLKSGHIKRGNLNNCLKPLVNDCEAATIIASLAKALVFCHCRGIVHQDVKLENVLLRPQHNSTFPEAMNASARGKYSTSCAKASTASSSTSNYCLKKAANQLPQDKNHNRCLGHDILLADFGIAEVLAPHKNCKLTGVAGTPIYMAPEMQQRRFYDERVDIYSLGVLLHVLLTGMALPSTRRPHVSLKDCHASDLLLRMLATNPEQRITLSDVLVHPWILQNTSTEAASCKLQANHSETLKSRLSNIMQMANNVSNMAATTAATSNANIDQLQYFATSEHQYKRHEHSHTTKSKLARAGVSVKCALAEMWHNMPHRHHKGIHIGQQNPLKSVPAI
ncbi:hypothetical protein L7F22_046075 [Adiantum nelumboides]|nr:hypothetical protein [Adiantum nelumboides]